MARTLSILPSVFARCLAGTAAIPDDEPERPRLKMTAAIACSKIDGYEQYEPLEDAAVSADEKLLLYYKPLNFHVERVGAAYRASLTQDFRIRKRGEKMVLRRKDDMLKYEPKTKQPPANLYITNTISLKGLPPGEYDLDLILHDRVGDAATATQVVQFRVKEPPAEKDSEEKPKPEAPKEKPSKEPPAEKNPKEMPKAAAE